MFPSFLLHPFYKAIKRRKTKQNYFNLKNYFIVSLIRPQSWRNSKEAVIDNKKIVKLLILIAVI
jgi:hypothetical protein